MEYFESCMDLTRQMSLAGTEHNFIVRTNESLITRARNTLAAEFMFDSRFKDSEALMFIDADIQFQAEDVATLWNLLVEGDHDIVTAAYPMKREGSDVTAWKDGKLVNLDDFDGPTEIDFAGTGFLMIRRRVFEKMAQKYTTLRHKEGHVGEVYAFFDTHVVHGDTWEDSWYCSEDYAFCDRWRGINGKIILDPSIRLGHVGRRVYR